MLVILPSPILELQHAPLAPKCCKPRSVSLTPCSSIVFILDSNLNLSRSLGVRQLQSYLLPSTTSKPSMLTKMKTTPLTSNSQDSPSSYLYLVFLLLQDDKPPLAYSYVPQPTNSNFLPFFIPSP